MRDVQRGALPVRLQEAMTEMLRVSEAAAPLMVGGEALHAPLAQISYLAQTIADLRDALDAATAESRVVYRLVAAYYRAGGEEANYVKAET